MKTLNIYIETFGCQMNLADSDILAAIMINNNYGIVQDVKHADIILLNTCSIRDNAEQRVKKRLKEFKSLKKRNKDLLIGIIGCMAERLRDTLITEENVDIVVGPDAYRSLPNLLNSIEDSKRVVNVELSETETYDDINPVKLNSNGVCAFIPIMRGCSNYCSYCVVPYTRGVERSRNPESIIKEAEELFKNGYREVTLIGQNVNSYMWNNSYMLDFPDLLKAIASINPLLRVRFATSHPKDISDKLLLLIAEKPNICKSIHLPVQSGSNRILKLMNRKYTREWYSEKILSIRKFIPDCSITTDIITGFCTETEQDHIDTLSLMKWAKFDAAFMFMYSERAGTYAAEYLTDNVPKSLKIKRLNEIILLQRELSLQSNKKEIGKVQQVLIEGYSKRSNDFLSGRTTYNKVVVFPAKNKKPGQYVNVLISKCTSATLIGEIVD